jgi:hypothetical protein
MRVFNIGYIGDGVKTSRYGVILMICDRRFDMQMNLCAI